MSAHEGFEQNTVSELEYIYVQGLGFVPQSPLEIEKRNLRVYANIVGLAILLCFFLQMQVPKLLKSVFTQIFPNVRYFNSHLMAPEWITQLISALSFVICYSLAFGVCMAFFKIPRCVALPFRRPTGKMLLPAVFISLAVASIGSFMYRILSGMLWGIGLISITQNYSIPLTPQGVLYALVSLCILPAFIGQCVFNGIILQSLRRFGDAFAIVTSAVLLSISGTHIVQMPSVFLMGIVIGYFVIRTGSLWTGIIINICNNIFAVSMFLLVPHITTGGMELISLLSVIIFIVLGLIFTVVLSNKSDNLFYLNCPQFAISVRHRIKIFFTSPIMLVVIGLITVISLSGLQRLPR